MKHLYRYLLIFGFLSLLALVSSAVVAAEKTVLVLGDSLSANYGINPESGWVNLLQQKIQSEEYPYQVVNASISGDTTQNGVTRLPDLLTRHHPAIVIIELGGNDGLRGIPLSITKSNLEKLIAMTINTNAKPLLLQMDIPPNYGPTYTHQFQQVYSDLAKKQHIDLVPHFLKGVGDNPQLMQADKIHPIAQAQPLLLENIWPYLGPLLSKQTHGSRILTGTKLVRCTH